MDIENKYGTLAIQKKLLSLMKVFHELCVQNDIKYIADSGTLLGAIRHDGFIPWDDDIDIVVDRENYEKLFKVDFSSYGLTSDRELWIDRIRFQDKNNFATIDILIMDKAPNFVFGRKVKFLSIAMLQGMLKDKPNYKGMSLPYKLLVASTYYTGKVFSKNVKLNLYSYISQYQKNKETQFVHCCSYMFKELQVLYPSNILDNLILHKFEDMEVYIPSNYDTYLKALYGDYRTPPSEENRKPIHVVVDNC